MTIRTRRRAPLRSRLLGGASAIVLAGALGMPLAAYADEAPSFNLEIGGGYDSYSKDGDSYAPEFTPLDSVGRANEGFNGFIAGTFRPGSMPYNFSGHVTYGRASTESFSTSYSSAKYAADASDEQDEHYILADLQVGRDIGLGGAARGTVSVGVRYANYQTDSLVSFSTSSKYGGQSASLPGKVQALVPGADFSTTGTISRSFSGLGPIVSMHVESPFSGRMGDMGFSFEGDVFVSVLFGDAKVDFSLPGSPADRSENHTVTDFGVSLALAWRPGDGPFRIKVGYRAEGLSDVLDGGFTSARDSSRYMDGPFASVVWRFP